MKVTTGAIVQSLLVSVVMVVASCSTPINFHKSGFAASEMSGGGIRLFDYEEGKPIRHDTLHFVTMCIPRDRASVPYRVFLLLSAEPDDPGISLNNESGVGEVLGRKIQPLDYHRAGIYAVRTNATIEPLDLTTEEEGALMRLFISKEHDHNPDKDAVKVSPLLPKLLSQLSRF
jgi:hypothetical protein